MIDLTPKSQTIKGPNKMNRCYIADKLDVTEFSCPYHDTDLYYGYINACLKPQIVSGECPIMALAKAKLEK